MKSAATYVPPAEAGYFTTRQWEDAFRGAFDLLRRDALTRNRRIAILHTPSPSSHKNHTQQRQTQQEASHVQVR